MADTTADPKTTGQPPKNETGYLLVVCVLLAVISVSLAWLWQTQKKRADAAQRALIEQRQANPLAQFLDKVQEMRPPVIQGGAPETIQFNGRPTPLFKVDPEEGKRLGFEPGDLIQVLEDRRRTPGPATAPLSENTHNVPTTAMTQPASRPTGSSSVQPGGSFNLGGSQRAKTQAAITQISNFGTALAAFEAECGRFPTTDEGLKALIEQPANAKGWTHSYLDAASIPNDPWGNPYVYRCPGQHNPDSYDLYSTGPDGTDANGENINNWKPKN